MMKQCSVCGLVAMVLGLGSQTVSAQEKVNQGKSYHVHMVALDQPLDELLTRLAEMKKKRETMTKDEQEVIAQIRAKLQAQRKALEEAEKKLSQYVPSTVSDVRIGGN